MNGTVQSNFNIVLFFSTYNAAVLKQGNCINKDENNTSLIIKNM